MIIIINILQARNICRQWSTRLAKREKEFVFVVVPVPNAALAGRHVKPLLSL